MDLGELALDPLMRPSETAFQPRDEGPQILGRGRQAVGSLGRLGFARRADRHLVDEVLREHLGLAEVARDAREAGELRVDLGGRRIMKKKEHLA